MESDTAEDSLLGSGKPKKNNASTSLCMDANTDDRSSDGVSNCLSLQSKHTIFLSHSGAQKDFVESLCADLEDCNRFPFFDKRPSSLPKGEKFPKLILEAAKRCKMAVVVVSEEYFTSKWPMLELNTFVQATLGSNPQLKILPLFFGMSVSEFGNSSRQEGWFHEWERWAKGDARIKPLEYKNALKVMQSFNGIEFNQEMRDVSMYQRDVVASICTIISPDVKWDDSHVQGRSNLCEAAREKIKKIESFGENGVCIFGFHGMGGIGKTTMCKTLCNELAEFSGKVCYIELGASRSSEELLKEVLKKLMNKSEEFLHNLNEGECLNILRKGILWEQKTFLAIDNVWDDYESMKQARMFLQGAAFHKGSVVMVTARTQTTLKYLGIDETQCFEVPELGETDARSLFLYHAAQGKQFANAEDCHVIKECIARCRFQKGEKQGFHYLPLALKALGMQLGCLGNSPSDWVKSLPMVRDFNHFQEKINPVFSIIRVNFDRLPMQEQALFMDIALYNPCQLRWTEDEGLIGWLSLVHRQTLKDTRSQVQRLIGKGLLEDVDLISQKVSMHDLYREFAQMESQGKLNPAGLNSRRWVYWRNTYPSDLEMTPSGRCWENLIRVGIKQETEYKAIAILSLEGIQWRYCSNVVVLKLVGLRELKAVLNLKGLRCLRSLELRFLDELDGVEGLEDLHSLTYFQWFGRYDNFSVEGTVRRVALGQPPALEYNGWPSESETAAPRSSLGQLPASLTVLQVQGVGVSVRSDVFARCTNLCKLTLSLIRAGDGLDFSQCTSLQIVVFKTIQGLQKLSGLAAGLTSCIQSLRIYQCADLIDVSELEYLVGLQRLKLEYLRLKKLPDLKKLTSLQVLTIQGCDGIVEVRGLGSLRQLRELSCSYSSEITELPNLSGLNQLHHLGLDGCRRLISLSGIGDLPALRDLDLYGSGVFWLPDLSKSTNLEDLNLQGSAVELLERDIRMLAELPKLRPVAVDNYPDDIRLDMVRRKVLRYHSKSQTVIEELDDLGPTPIRVRDYSANVTFIYFK